MVWPGSRWWKFDFHAHTPASNDFGKGNQQAQQKSITPRDWLLNYMRAQVDCVAITDHNSGAWIDQLKRDLRALEEENHPEFRPLHLFPGVELTVNGNVHVLAILPTDRSTSDIDTLLGAVGYRATKGSSDGCTERSFTDVIDEIVAHGGIAIPAHVDQPAGLFEVYSGNTLNQVLDHKEIFAMEVVDPAKPKPKLYTDRKLAWAEILGSDCHHADKSLAPRHPGSHFTWVKMSKPTIEGLKLALLDGDLSLRRSDTFEKDPNTFSSLIIERLEIDEAKYLGRGATFVAALNPWLNCIIGGRGTGKSTILEFLRMALGRQSEIPKSLEADVARYSQVSTHRNDEGLLTPDTKLKIYVQKDGRRFKITWHGSDIQIEEERGRGNWVLSEGDVAQRFPVRVYSQKHIFELAKHPQALLRVVDEAPEVNYRAWKSKWDELVSQYLASRAQAREVASGLKEERIVRGQLDDIRRKLEVFEEAGHTNVLKAYQLREDQRRAIESWESGWSGSADRLREFASYLIPEDLDDSFFLDVSSENSELRAMVGDVHSAYRVVQQELLQIAERLDSIKSRWFVAKPALGISKVIEDTRMQYTQLVERLAEAEAGDPTEYASLVAQRQELEDTLREFEIKRAELAEREAAADQLRQEIAKHRLRITELRSSFLAKTLKGNQFVRIGVVPFGDKASVEDEFRRLIGRDQLGGFERDIGRPDGEEGLLSQIYSSTLTSVEDGIAMVKQTLRRMWENDVGEVAVAKDRRFVNHVQSLTPEQIDRIMCWFPEDSLDVNYSLKNSGDFKPIEQGSPGQKTAALLAFILSYGDEPLILDQPEDDLDNHLIYDLIVSQLRGIKQKRQVIVVTHNANIVVNGDAENVIALDIRGGQTRIVAQGGLQDHTIRREVCRVMEGGAEAFEQRYRRIGAVG